MMIGSVGSIIDWRFVVGGNWNGLHHWWRNINTEICKHRKDVHHINTYHIITWSDNHNNHNHCDSEEVDTRSGECWS